MFEKIRILYLQPHLQLLATIYASRNVTLKKSVKNYIYLHNKLQVVANGESGCPCRADTKITKVTMKSTKSNHEIN